MSSTVPYGARDKHAAVRTMFGRIARRYDVANRLMTLGMDGLWRGWTAQAAALPDGGLGLDVGTGTGDLALTLAQASPGARVIGLDYTGEMLAFAPGKAADLALGHRTGWIRGDGHTLPFADDAFDAVTSAWVLRNFADLPTAYREMARVTKPGGRVVALEMSPVSTPVWRQLFELYMGRIVPILGKLVTGDDGAYRYLPESARAFLTPEAVADVMRSVGLEPQPHQPVMGGGLAIHIGVKPGMRGFGPGGDAAARTRRDAHAKPRATAEDDDEGPI